MEEKYYCEVCGKELIDYNPQFCCNAFDCGCQGKPTNPPICSNECWDKLMEDSKNNPPDKP